MSVSLQNILITNSNTESYKQLKNDLSGLALHFHKIEALSGIIDFNRQYPVSMVIIDQFSIETDQLNLLFKIKSTFPTLNIFVILPESKPQTVRATFEMGCSDLITAPYSKDELFCRIEKQLYVAQLNNELQNALEVKSDFSANMSHEIRTPLNGIIGILNILQETQLNQNQSELISLISNSSEALLSLVNNILDFAKLEANKMTLRPEVFNFHLLCTQTLEILESRSKDKNLPIELNFDPQLESLNLSADKGRLRQVILNLLSNAIKFTKKGSVTLKACLIDKQEQIATIRVAVIDTGMGIKPEKKELIFSKFTQIDSSHARSHGGTGLGLPISNMILQCMNSHLEVNSEVGTGSTFSFEFTTPFNTNDTASSTPILETTVPTLPPLRILIAEDNMVNQRVILSYLTKETEHYIKTALNGQEVLDHLDKDVFDLILMDIQMPIMDGITATKRIRSSQKKYANSKIIAITANAMEGDKEKYLNIGMNAYIPKPFTQDQLLIKIHQVLTRDTNHLSQTSDNSSEKKELIEASIIQEVVDNMGEEGFYDLIKIYLKDVDSILSRLRKAAKERDVDTFIHASHKYAGGAAVLGFIQASEIARDMETLSRNQQYNDAVSKVDELEFVHKRTLVALRAKFPKLKKLS